MLLLKNFIVLHSVLNVAVDAASVFPEAKFFDRLHRFFHGVLGTFHLFYKLNPTYWSLILRS